MFKKALQPSSNFEKRKYEDRKETKDLINEGFRKNFFRQEIGREVQERDGY